MSENTSGCGCGKHRHAPVVEPERAEAPAVVQPRAQEADANGVVPGRKAGNDLGLRDASAPGRGGCGCGHGGCGCGGHQGSRHWRALTGSDGR
ncbi:MAG: hypothetical protein Q4C85_11570 [Actinomyces sp.]|uniref:hypothetical protein n=1 Tax=Actinomyces sp. TaxID=29317 RepID=UPI0026DD1022|nr:hypothetical protein [Actinomyces sp.]MDO4244363.1 hypothetical protein [Actinomyces sp.]